MPQCGIRDRVGLIAAHPKHSVPPLIRCATIPTWQRRPRSRVCKRQARLEFASYLPRDGYISEFTVTVAYCTTSSSTAVTPTSCTNKSSPRGEATCRD